MKVSIAPSAPTQIAPWIMVAHFVPDEAFDRYVAEFHVFAEKRGYESAVRRSYLTPGGIAMVFEVAGGQVYASVGKRDEGFLLKVGPVPGGKGEPDRAAAEAAFWDIERALRSLPGVKDVTKPSDRKGTN